MTTPNVNHVLLKKKKKRSVSRFNICPFRIRATYSLKRKKWNIVVINNTHSHPLKFNPDSEEYKKFKLKLREDGDLEAIKKFDELEYKTRKNLPIQSSMIPCDCGLTNEIQSFNIVLPSGRTAANSNDTATATSSRPIKKLLSANLISTSNGGNNNNVQKPRTRVNDKRNKENLLKKTTTTNFLTNNGTAPAIPTNRVNSLVENSNSMTDFLDDPFNSSMNIPMNDFAPFNLEAVTNLNEIDFTDIFNKPTTLQQDDGPFSTLNEMHIHDQQTPYAADMSIFSSLDTASLTRFQSPMHDVNDSPLLRNPSNTTNSEMLDYMSNQHTTQENNVIPNNGNNNNNTTLANELDVFKMVDGELKIIEDDNALLKINSTTGRHDNPEMTNTSNEHNPYMFHASPAVQAEGQFWQNNITNNDSINITSSMNQITDNTTNTNSNIQSINMQLIELNNTSKKYDDHNNNNNNNINSHNHNNSN